jgi:60 kDa SS-A/Ro ribonucleoprotein
VLRQNPKARVLPFEDKVVKVALDGAASVAENAARLASIGGGGTNCSAPLAQLNREKAKPDLVLFISDNQSWIDAGSASATPTMHEWAKLKARAPKAKLVCIDIAPFGTTQAREDTDILNVGGFSDAVFDVVSAFANGSMDVDHWVGQIERIEL